MRHVFFLLLLLLLLGNGVLWLLTPPPLLPQEITWKTIPQNLSVESTLPHLWSNFGSHSFQSVSSSLAFPSPNSSLVQTFFLDRPLLFHTPAFRNPEKIRFSYGTITLLSLGSPKISEHYEYMAFQIPSISPP